MSFSRLFPLVVAAFVALSACGGGSSGPGVEAGLNESLRPLVLSAVQTNTEAEGTAQTRFVMRMSMSGIPDEPDQSFEVTAEGAVDIANERARFVVDLPDEMTDEAMPFAGSMEVIADGDTVYLRVPDGTAPADKPWIRMPSEGFDLTGLGMGGLSSSFDPGLNLELLDLGDPSKVETVGREDVRGVSTVHYRVTVQPGDAAAAGAEDEAFMQMFSAGEALVYDVWVDDDERLRKLTFSFDLAAMLKAMFEGFSTAFGEMASELGEEGETPSTTFPTDMSMLMEMEMEAWAFGDPVDIQLPPADQITEAPPGFSL